MPDRDIAFEDVKTPANVFRLKEHLRELYRLVEYHFISIVRAASIIIDADEGDIFYILLDGNITSITINNPAQGRKIVLIFKQDGTGSRTVAGFASNVMLAGDAFSVTSNAGKYTILTLCYDGTNWVEIARTTDVY